MRLANLVFAFADFYDKGDHLVAVIRQIWKIEILLFRYTPASAFFFLRTTTVIGRF